MIVTTFVHNRAGFQTDGTPDNEIENGWGCYDLGLQNENLILKATELGLSTLIMGLRDGDKIREMLSIPESETIVSVIAVGKPMKNQPSETQRVGGCSEVLFKTCLKRLSARCVLQFVGTILRARYSTKIT